jgi:hypothetical protein
MDLSDKTALIFDSGAFCHIAEKMAESYGQVMYFIPWVNDAHPTSTSRASGTGLPNVTRVYSWLNHIREADVIIFPFTYNWDECQFVRDLNLPVWGSGRAEALETERWKTHLLMAEMGMPTIDAELVIGTDALREYLKDKDDLYIKCSVTRGDFETRHHVNAKITEPWIVSLDQKLGPLRNEFEFIVEQAMPGFETGYDGYFIDRDYGGIGTYGFEIKDCGYVARVSTFSDLPKQIKQVNRAFAPAMAALGMRGFFSNEIRIGKDGTPYFIDPTMRAGWPPSALYMELYENWGEVIYAGARGQIIDLIPKAEYGAEIILKSPWVKDHELSVDVPDKIAPWIKLGNSCVIDGQRYVLPEKDVEFGSALGIGSTLKEACEMAVENAEAVEALDIDYRHDVFEAAQAEIEKGEEYGITF